MSDENEVIEDDEDTGQPEADAPQDDTEARARRMGWVDKSEYRGDPAKWRPADEFVSRAEQIPGVTADMLRKMEAKLAKMEREAEERAEFYTKQQQRAYDRALRDIRAKQEAAVDTGDKDAFRAAQKEADDLAEERAASAKAAEAKAEDPGSNPIVAAWEAKNPWYGDNLAMTAFANQVGQAAAAKGLTGAAFFKAVDEAMAEQFPNKFTNPRRAGANAVEGGGRTPGGGKTRTLAALPAADRRIAQEDIARIQKKNPNYTVEDWLKTYEEA